ncbi:MAG: hypothetical protein PHZ09_09070 [Eubacteriales bacterium]|nr:hypothetical protein [Eubacteriales bacterium]
MEKQFLPIISAIADYYEKLFADCKNAVESAGFWGHDFGIKRLGYIALPLSLRSRSEI